MAQVEQEEMPVIAGYRLTTNFLRGYFQGKESFARKRAAQTVRPVGADQGARQRPLRGVVGGHPLHPQKRPGQEGPEGHAGPL